MNDTIDVKLDIIASTKAQLLDAFAGLERSVSTDNVTGVVHEQLKFLSLEQFDEDSELQSLPATKARGATAPTKKKMSREELEALEVSALEKQANFLKRWYDPAPIKSEPEDAKLDLNSSEDDDDEDFTSKLNKVANDDSSETDDPRPTGASPVNMHSHRSPSSPVRVARSPPAKRTPPPKHRTPKITFAGRRRLPPSDDEAIRGVGSVVLDGDSRSNPAKPLTCC